MADTSGWPNEDLMSTEFVYFCILLVFGIFVSTSYVSCIFITSWILGFSWKHSFFSIYIWQTHSSYYLCLLGTSYKFHPPYLFFFFFYSIALSSQQKQTHITSHSQNVQFFHSNISCRCVIIVHHYYNAEIASFEQFTVSTAGPFSQSFQKAPELVAASTISQTMKLHEALYIRRPIFHLYCLCSVRVAGVLRSYFVDLSSVLP